MWQNISIYEIQNVTENLAHTSQKQPIYVVTFFQALSNAWCAFGFVHSLVT